MIHEAIAYVIFAIGIMFALVGVPLLTVMFAQWLDRHINGDA